MAHYLLRTVLHSMTTPYIIQTTLTRKTREIIICKYIHIIVKHNTTDLLIPNLRRDPSQLKRPTRRPDKPVYSVTRILKTIMYHICSKPQPWVFALQFDDSIDRLFDVNRSYYPLPNVNTETNLERGQKPTIQTGTRSTK